MSSASSTSAASSSSSAATSSTPTSAPTSIPAPIPSPAPHTDSFPTSAKIGFGVGIPVALILGLIAGFLLVRRHKKKDTTTLQTHGIQVAEQYKYGPNDAGCYAPRINEAPPESLVELDPQHAAGVHAPKTRNDGSAPERYEM